MKLNLTPILLVPLVKCNYLLNQSCSTCFNTVSCMKEDERERDKGAMSESQEGVSSVKESIIE